MTILVLLYASCHIAISCKRWLFLLPKYCWKLNNSLTSSLLLPCMLITPRPLHLNSLTSSLLLPCMLITPRPLHLNSRAAQLLYFLQSILTHLLPHSPSTVFIIPSNIFIFLLRTIFLLSGDKSPPVLCIRKTVYFILVLEGYFYWYETLGDYTLSLQLSCMRFIELPEYLDSCLPSVLENFQSLPLQLFLWLVSIYASRTSVTHMWKFLIMPHCLLHS